jgi:hypothetical protein
VKTPLAEALAPERHGKRPAAVDTDDLHAEQDAAYCTDGGQDQPGPARPRPEDDTMNVDAVITELREDSKRGHGVEEQSRMDNGTDFMPWSAVYEGDVKEVKGFWDQHVFKRVTQEEIPEGARYIDMRLVRRVKGDKVKSRLVLRDIARSRGDPEDTYAATPALSAFRLALTLASRSIKEAEAKGTASPVAEILDIAQAFVHAEMDRWILTEVPKELDGMTFATEDGETIVLTAGELLLVLRALYGFRPAPRLWQQLAVKILDSRGSKQSKMESMMFHNQKKKKKNLLGAPSTRGTCAHRNASQ